MIVRVYEIERPTGREWFLHHSELSDIELCGESTHTVTAELDRAGRCWIGGGPDRLFYLAKVQA